MVNKNTELKKEFEEKFTFGGISGSVAMRVHDATKVWSWFESKLEERDEEIKDLKKTIRELVMKYNPVGYALHEMEES